MLSNLIDEDSHVDLRREFRQRDARENALTDTSSEGLEGIGRVGQPGSACTARADNLT